MVKFSYKDNPNVYVYEMIHISPCNNHRTRTWYWFKNNQIYRRTLIKSDYQASLATLRELVIPAVAEGKIKAAIDEVLGLEDVAGALLRMEQRGIMGKIVVVPK